MEHYIIVKFNDEVNVKDLVGSIKELFDRALEINGVEKIDIYTSCLELDNRHDLMIKMHLSDDGLKNFDNSNIHKEWKEKYGKFIINKTIFDCNK